MCSIFCEQIKSYLISWVIYFRDIRKADIIAKI